MAQNSSDFNYHVDRFADIEVLRYQVPGFNELTLQQKQYIYYLSQAAMAGRDILFDQNYRYNLAIRTVLETMYVHYTGDRNNEDFKQFEIYLKRIWFSNGIHHHYSTDKILPEFSEDFLMHAFASLPDTVKWSIENDLRENVFDGATHPFRQLVSIMFDPTIAPKRVNQTEGQDVIITSANNYYLQPAFKCLKSSSKPITSTNTPLSQQEVKDFYNAQRNPNDQTPVSYGLNSRLEKNEDGSLQENVWKINGMYSKEISEIISWLEKAKTVAENDKQKEIISLLIDFYTSGNLKTFDDYSIAWVKDTASHIDFVNGFIETYGDPLGIKASWESIVNFKNIEASNRTEIISKNAQWFEDNSPVDTRFKKDKVKGVSAKVITMAMLGGDCYPHTPIGINLPNSNWIRETHGSKSVTIDNITDAYDKASQSSGFAEEFMFSQVEIDRKRKYGKLGDDLHTDLHECLGHGSGKLLPGVSQEALGVYGATIEEARADLFALYYLADPKLVELGLLPDQEAYKSEYYGYMMNGLLTQTIRIELGKDIEESHMRNRAMIAQWVLNNTTASTIEITIKDGKHFVKVNDYKNLRVLFGALLQEIQRIKSEGDFEAAKKLVEDYGVKIDKNLHAEMLERYKKLNLAPYKGFINPVYTPIVNEQGEIIDISIDYTEGYVEQMLRYGQTQQSTTQNQN
ncbi:MAG: dipeptidyl peptidase 3 [Bacteroidales bacterium]|jgi:dipeptidyl-peptidase-3|nr:dipeptidyl peptidase 3 [Bacteroidales bacterium]